MGYGVFMHEETPSESITREDVGEPRLVSVETTQYLLGKLTYRQIGLMVKRGELRSCKIGRRRMIEAASIDEYIDAKLAQARSLKQRRKAAA